MKHLERALDGQNQWWKYILTFILIIFAAGIGTIPFFLVMPGNRDMSNFSAYGISAHFGLALLLFSFVIALIAFVPVVKSLHKRSLSETINGTSKIRWSRFFVGAAYWGGAGVLVIFLNAGLDPHNYKFNFDAAALIPLTLVSFIIIPIQASFEEVLFRGYMAQGFAARTKSRWLVLIIPSLLFALMHFSNPEVLEHGFWLTMPGYLFIGLLFGLFTILDDGIEIAMGMHAINNILGSILITNKSSTFQTPALLTELQINPLKDLALEVIMGLVLIVILTKKYKWNYGILNKKVKADEGAPNNNEALITVHGTGLMPNSK